MCGLKITRCGFCFHGCTTDVSNAPGWVHPTASKATEYLLLINHQCISSLHTGTEKHPSLQYCNVLNAHCARASFLQVAALTFLALIPPKSVCVGCNLFFQQQLNLHPGFHTFSSTTAVQFRVFMHFLLFLIKNKKTFYKTEIVNNPNLRTGFCFYRRSFFTLFISRFSATRLIYSNFIKICPLFIYLYISGVFFLN